MHICPFYLEERMFFFQGLPEWEEFNKRMVFFHATLKTILLLNSTHPGKP